MSRRTGENLHYFAILNNLDKQSTDIRHVKEGRRNKQLPEVGRSRKPGVTVARAEEPQSSRQV